LEHIFINLILREMLNVSFYFGWLFWDYKIPEIIDLLKLENILLNKNLREMLNVYFDFEQLIWEYKMQWDCVKIGKYFTQ